MSQETTRSEKGGDTHGRRANTPTGKETRGGSRIYWKLPREVNELFGLNRSPNTAISGDEPENCIVPRPPTVTG